MGGESTERVIRANQDADSASSSSTLSCMKDSNEAMIDVETKKAERTITRTNLRLGYNWVNPKVREFFSRYRFSKDLRDFLSNTHIYSPNVVDDIISFRRTGDIDNVCHGREDDNCEFFYFYECFFTDLHVRFPLSEFQMGVLNYLNIAHTQLHPNG